MSINADTLALAVMDDDGFGCAITSTPEPAGRPALCAACFMAGTDWGAHRCQGTVEAPCFCFCQFPDDPDPDDDPAGYVVVLRGHYHDATGYEDRLCACPNPLTYAPQPRWYDPREGN